ncbi:major facilitator superfamily transporter [Tritrichomonas foetus]|uniref:Lysosomal dipeptide transporter MFSD1 n=1 Tax=Tritrichomonas foetus TaxID=1144522 RepID=A0A1J4KTT3_9EUKA|nr:major facilitator superfamily transporter [Tritrichomonas foetus]|eukprot:OHT13070.1 major facilitator superfamily transporter [Tritrichomonas foetus]
MATEALIGSSDNLTDLKPPTGCNYSFRKWFAIFLSGFSYIFVYFHRFTTAVLADLMARDLNVPKTSLGIFTSMYFWPYGLMQPFVGSLADIFEPGYMIAIANIVSASGALLCAFSHSLAVGCVGRFLVGLGCSGIFVPTNKIAANWFTPQQFRFFSGALIGLGGIGSLLSQTPLSVVGHAIGWRLCLSGVAIVSFVIAILSFFFVKGHPRSLGYYSDVPLPPKVKASELFGQLVRNLKNMVKLGDFWMLALFMFFAPGIYMDVSAMWGVPYLEDVFKYDANKASLVQMALSISIIIGSPLLPVISEKVKSRKWTLFVVNIFSLAAALILALTKDILPTAAIIACYFFFGVGSSASQGAALAMFKEFADISLAATLVGGGNTGPFIGGALLQTITSEIMKTYGNHVHYPIESYAISLWGLSAVALLLADFCLLFLKEPKMDQTHVTLE